MLGGRLINNHIKQLQPFPQTTKQDTQKVMKALFIERHSDFGNCCCKGACIAYNDQIEKLAVSGCIATDVANYNLNPD